MPKRKTFEQAIDRLEDIADELERNEVTLDEAVSLYKEGMELSVFCADKIKKAKSALQLLQRDEDGNIITMPFTDLEE